MVRAFPALVLVVAVVASVRGGDPGAPADLQAVQGNWKPASLKYEEADAMPADMMRQITGVYDGNEFHLYFVDRGREGPKPLKLMVAKVVFDSTAAPKAMTFECERGGLKGQKLHGIYELAGNTLKVCYGPADRPRPSTFEAVKGSGCFCEVWVRQAK